MSARNVAVVGFAHAPHVRRTDGTTNGVEMLMPCFAQLYEELDITQADIGFWCSGSSDYLAGRAFSFISAIDSIGAVPPINESHVEMDAAWALYEAYIKILTGEIDTALVYGFGKSSAGILRQILSRQTDPYTVAPLWPDSVSMAGLQARIGLDSGKWTPEQMAAGCPRLVRPRRTGGLRKAGEEHRRTARRARSSTTHCGATTSHRSPTAPPRSCSPPTTVPANYAKNLPG